MVPYYGDFPEDATIYIPINTFDSNDPAASVTVTNLLNTDVHIHKNGGTTQRNNAAGITMTIDYDSITGNHLLIIDTSDDTVAGFWVTGAEYQVRVEGITVDAGTLNSWVGAFSIERTGGALANSKELLTRIPDATAGANGGLTICGSNAATTYATLTVTGATTLTGNVALADGLTVAAPSTADRAGITVTGNGTGSGIKSTGGGTNANGMTLVGGATNGIGLYAQGAGSGTGIRADGGATGHGIYGVGSGNGNGMILNGAGTGHGIQAGGGATGHGINAAGGATSGDGIHAEASTSGDGVYAKAAGTGHGLACHGGGVAGDGINALADNDGDGIESTGATNGHGMVLTGVGTGEGFSATGGATGAGMLLAGGGNNADADGLRVVAGGALATDIDADLPWNAAWDAEVQSECDDAITANALILDIPTTAEFNARTIVSADYTVVGDLGVVQTADHTAAIADIPTVAEFNARSIVSADYTVVADLGTVQTADHTASIAAIKAITDLLPSGIKKNTALANFEFYMVLAADHISPALLKVVDCQRSIDGAAFANCNAPVATEVSAGIYKLDLAASDLNGDVVTLKFSEATCDTRLITIKTST